MHPPIDGIIFEDFARARESHALDHRTALPMPVKWYIGGARGPTDTHLRGHPTRADDRLRKF